ncbi:hypothetical protein BDW67DRAFT_179092 [Aspergillus spinulosporus]
MSPSTRHRHPVHCIVVKPVQDLPSPQEYSTDSEKQNFLRCTTLRCLQIGAVENVVIAGGGPRAISAALEFIDRGYDMRVFERQPECRAIGGAERTVLLLKKEVERCMGIKVFGKMLDLVNGYEVTDGVTICFKNGKTGTAVILIAADGIRSSLFHTGIRLWLAWCDQIPDNPSNYAFPVLHNGKPGYECGWSSRAHVVSTLKHWTDSMPRLVIATNFDTQVYWWEIYNCPPLKEWPKERINGVGDAVHPVSSYAAYGMGMAIEDGYSLARALDGVDLRDARTASASFEIFGKQRVNYVNHYMEFTRFSSKMLHRYLKSAEEETMGLKELHVA